MHALLIAEAFKSFDKFGRENALEWLSDGLSTAEGVHGLHLSIPAFDAVVEG